VTPAAGDAEAAAPYVRSLGLQVEHVVPERALVRVPHRDDNANAGGVLHGGVIASAVEVAGVLVARAGAAPRGREGGALELAVCYLSASIGEDVVADARLRRRGREIVHVDVAVGSPVGKPVATGSLTYRFVTAAQRAGSWSAPMPEAPTSLVRPPVADVFEASPFIASLGVRMLHAADGGARLALPARDGSPVHEGALAALLDTAGAAASWSLAPPDPRVRGSTVGIRMGLHALATGEVIADARVLHRRNEIVAVRVALGASGRTVASGTVTYRLLVPEA